MCFRQAVPGSRTQRFIFALTAILPDRTDCVQDILAGKTAGLRNGYLSGWNTPMLTDPPATFFLDHLTAAVDNSSGNPGTMYKVRVGSVHDGVYVFLGQITLTNLDYLFRLGNQFCFEDAHLRFSSDLRMATTRLYSNLFTHAC